MSLSVRAGIGIVAPTHETCVLSTGIPVVTFFEFFTRLGSAVGLRCVNAYFIFSAAIHGAGIPVVAGIIGFAIFRALNWEVDANTFSHIAAICRAAIVVVAIGIQYAGLTRAQ